MAARHDFNKCCGVFALQILVGEVSCLLRDLALDQMEKVTPLLVEVLVLEALLVLDVASFVKIIHIHLPHKRAIVVVLEVLW
jgi:hypothetical protein